MSLKPNESSIEVRAKQSIDDVLFEDCIAVGRDYKLW